jgi:hypothetical protein
MLPSVIGGPVGAPPLTQVRVTRQNDLLLASSGFYFLGAEHYLKARTDLRHRGPAVSYVRQLGLLTYDETGARRRRY